MAEIDAIINDEQKLLDITRAVFAECDKSGDGKITRPELKEAMITVAGEAGMPEPGDHQVDEVLRALDTNRDGTLTLQEFKVLIRAVLIALKDV